MPRRKRDRRHDNPGRPPVLGVRAAARLELRLPADTLALFRERAAAEGLKVSEWLRRLGLEALKLPPHRPPQPRDAPAAEQ